MKKVNGIRVLVAICLMKMLCVGFLGAAADHPDQRYAHANMCAAGTSIDTDITGITGDITGGTAVPVVAWRGQRALTTETRTNTPGAKQWVRGAHGVHGLPFMDDHSHQLPKVEQQVQIAQKKRAAPGNAT